MDSLFGPDGTAKSPDEGFVVGGLDWPQGTHADPSGNIWVANCMSSTVTLIPEGDPDRARPLADLGLLQPFDIAGNGTGNVFVTGQDSNNVGVLGPDGTPQPWSPVTGGGIDSPMGIASDSTGHLWVANSGAVTLPCPDRATINATIGSVTLLAPDGRPVADTSFKGGGLTLPWGIAVDSNDNVWVANFGGKRLSHVCGTNPANCPQGKGTGDPISPDVTGYFFDGLVRNTGVAIDTAGNVWVANNWLEVPVQTNPGGHEIVAFVGLAGPVQPPTPIPHPQPTPTPTPYPTPTPVQPLRPEFTG